MSPCEVNGSERPQKSIPLNQQIYELLRVVGLDNLIYGQFPRPQAAKFYRRGKRFRMAKMVVVDLQTHSRLLSGIPGDEGSTRRVQSKTGYGVLDDRSLHLDL